MEKRKIGKSDLEVSVVGFGCWVLGGQWTGSNDTNAINAVKKSLEFGVNFFDVAPVYGYGHAEEVLSKALEGQRDKVIIATKCGLRWGEDLKTINNLSRESILWEIDQSLRRLRTDYIDLYQLHWPDYNTPIEETMETMNDLKKAGKIRYIGISNFPVKLAKEAMKYSEVVSQQCLYNMLDRNEDSYHEIPLYYHTEEEILPFCKENNIGFLPYSPLCQGLLTGKFKESNNFDDNDVRSANPMLRGEVLKERLKVVKKLQKVAEKIGKPLNQIAINWLISNSTVTSVISGSKNPIQAEQNCLSSTWKLDDETLQEINNILYDTGAAV